MDAGHNYFIINKPYAMVSQFKSPHAVNLLGQLDYSFPAGTHAVGRLDNHSEGLLILTTDKTVTRRLFMAAEPHRRTYLVQINNQLSCYNLQQLQQGVDITIAEGKKYRTPACDVSIVTDPLSLYPYASPTDQYGLHTWLTITLTEGKYHQVRKMIGAVHHRVKRLIRISIEELMLGQLAPGAVQPIDAKTLFQQLHI